MVSNTILGSKGPVPDQNACKLTVLVAVQSARDWMRTSVLSMVTRCSRPTAPIESGGTRVLLNGWGRASVLAHASGRTSVGEHANGKRSGSSGAAPPIGPALPRCGRGAGPGRNGGAVVAGGGPTLRSWRARSFHAAMRVGCNVVLSCVAAAGIRTTETAAKAASRRV